MSLMTHDNDGNHCVPRAAADAEAQRLTARIEALETALVDCTNELDSYGEEMPFTATGIEAHKERVAKFRKVIKGDEE